MEFDFKIEPIWRNKPILGLDIGSRFVKVVQLEKSGKLTKLVGYGEVVVPENYIIEGIISEPEKMAEVIKVLFENKVWGKITANRVNASLPESKIFTRIINLPHMGEKELKEAVNWEAAQSIPMSLSDLYLDWKVLGPSKADPKMEEIIIAAAPKAIVNSYLQLFKALDLQPMSIETSLTAITRAMIPSKNKNETVLVIDLGGQTTNVAIFDHEIRVTGSIPIGGDNITKMIEPVFNVDRNEAEKIKIENSSKNKTKIKEIVDSEISEILKEVRRMINYYSEKVNKQNPIDRILLCGGNAVIPEITDYFKDKLGLPTTIGNPWSNISVYPIKSVPKNEIPAYTNAIGLALLGLENE